MAIKSQVTLEFDEQIESQSRFASSEYQDHSPYPHRPDRWFNGSLIGNGANNSSLFGPNSRLRSLHTKITSQETPGSHPRGQFYRLVGDILSQFFPCAILDPIIEELISLEAIRLPQAMDEAICVVLAAVEMYLRKYKRTILKEKLIAEIAVILGVDINRKRLVGAKWFLARSGFWHEHLHEINTGSYDILRNLTLEIITDFSSSLQEDSPAFRRRLRRRCNDYILILAKTKRRPQALEIYAHVIASLAAEDLLKRPITSSQPLGNPRFDKRVCRAKHQFFEMLQVLKK
ncbi:MAG: hypothetical protein ACXACI_16630 [Candidatus Hodarchaeales archaeon]|jgi:hypothetical protein